MKTENPINSTHLRINGIGEVIEVTIHAYYPGSDMWPSIYSPYNGRRYGVPDMCCYACHGVLNGGFQSLLVPVWSKELKE